MKNLNKQVNDAINGDDEEPNVKHKEMLAKLLEDLEEIDLVAAANLDNPKKLQMKHFLIITIDQVRKVALRRKWALCTHNGFLYAYNSQYWQLLEKEIIKWFLGCAAEKLGIDMFTARYFSFRDQLMRQFMSQAFLQKPENIGKKTLVNLLNGTCEIGPEGVNLRDFDQNDFLTYQLPFNYDQKATAPLFYAFINRVVPDISCQNVLSEFIGSVFIKTETLKLEKALMLYGEGANGKSVFYDITFALLGDSNISSYSLHSLMDNSGYYRAMLSNKLLNYASEITGELEAGMFKQLTSGEAVPARPIYCEPITVKDYAKLAFNCNGLPKNVEHTHAYYRRFLIIPFNVTIPENEQDRQLVQKIIGAGELSGIFNWVLAGLNRLLAQKGFTHSEAVNKELAKYKAESDNVKLFLEEYEYIESDDYIAVKYISNEYGEFCKEYRYKPLSHGNFVKRLRALAVRIEKRNVGLVAFIAKAVPLSEDRAIDKSPYSSLFDHEQV